MERGSTANKGIGKARRNPRGRQQLREEGLAEGGISLLDKELQVTSDCVERGVGLSRVLVPKLAIQYKVVIPETKNMLSRLYLYLCTHTYPYA